MATPTLEAYRRLNPHLADRSDDDLLDSLASQLQGEGTIHQYPDVVEALQAKDRAYRQAHKPNPAKEFVRSMIGGIDTAQGMGYSAIAQLGAASGIDAVKNFGIQGYQRNQVEAAQNQPTVRSVDDINGVGDAIYYGLGVAGSQAPQIGATLLASGAGALAGAAMGGPAGAGAGAAAARGAMLGGMAAGYVQGQNYADLETSGAEDPLLTSATVGALSSYLEMLVPARIIHKAFGTEARDLTKLGLQELLARANRAAPGLVASMAKEAASDAAGEALTETAQELVTMAGEIYANRNNGNFHLTDKEIRDRLLNSAVAGGILGGLAGAPAGLSQRKSEIAERLLAGKMAEEFKAKALERAFAPQVPNSFNEAQQPVYDEQVNPSVPTTPFSFDEFKQPTYQDEQPAPLAPEAPAPAAQPQAQPAVVPAASFSDIVPQQQAPVQPAAQPEAPPAAPAPIVETPPVAPIASLGKVNEPILAEPDLKYLEGKTVQLTAFDENGQPVPVQMDAKQAWKETHNQVSVFTLLRDCLETSV